MPGISQVNFLNMLKSDQSNSHHDVEFVFNVTSQKNGGVGDPASSLGETKESVSEDKADKVESLFAHKLVLAWVSPVLDVQFFGLMAEETSTEPCRVVGIKDFSKGSFEIFIRLVYGEKKEIVTQCDKLDTLFELFKLADKYQVDDIRSLVNSTIVYFKVTVSNMFEVLAVLEIYKNLLNFGGICSKLKTKCMIAVQTELKTPFDMVKLWNDNQDKADLVNLLFKALGLDTDKFTKSPCTICKSVSIPCSNCKSAPCKDGLPVSRSVFGTRVTRTSGTTTTKGVISIAAERPNPHVTHHTSLYAVVHSEDGSSVCVNHPVSTRLRYRCN